MNVFGVIAMFLALFLIVVASEDSDQKRPNRGNMMAFPRVGRSDPWLQNDYGKRDKWNILPLNTGRSAFSNWDGEDAIERKEIYRRASENKPGLWFGPRMGRVHKRNSLDDDAVPWATIIINGIPIPSKFIYNTNLPEESSSNFIEKQKEDLQ